MHPLDYLRIRARAFNKLLRVGEDTAAWVVETKSVENPWGFTFVNNRFSDTLVATTRDQAWLYFPWIYIALVAAAAIATPLVHRKLRRLNITLAAASIAFTMPHFFVAPASDYRYLHFVTLCALIQAAIACAGATSAIHKVAFEKDQIGRLKVAYRKTTTAVRKAMTAAMRSMAFMACSIRPPRK